MPADPGGPVPHAHSVTLADVLRVLAEVRDRLAALEAPAVWLDSTEVVRHAKLSLKTLLRADESGEDCGLRRVGVKLVFHRPTLDGFLLRQRRDVTSDGLMSAAAH